MARAGPSRPTRQFSKDYNAKQAQARRERKVNVDGPSSIHDVFEYVTNKEEAGQSGVRRSKRKDDRMLKRATRNDADDLDVSRGRGKRAANSDEDDDDEDEAGGDKFQQTAPAWDEEDHGVRSEDEEEIDSDEAFGESDEEKFEGWKFGGGKATKISKGRKSVEDGESAEESVDDDDEDDDDLMDISKMLDGDGGEDDSESEDDEDGDDDSDDERLHHRMQTIAATSGTKRPAEESEYGGKKGPKRRVLSERSEAVPEGEWNVPSRKTGSSLLTIDDLMEPVREQGGTAFTSLRDSAKVLKPKRGDSKQVSASKKGSGTLQAPLPTILQDRIDRAAAYDETKAEVQGWQPTIKRIREAEHLSFPLQPEAKILPSTALMTSQFKPTNSFERDVAMMLEKEGLSDKKLAEAEELKMNERGMSAEEIQARRSELRKMRDLLFREEQKSKRVSKIKSKTYRKIARKQRERELAKAKEAGILLDDLDEGAESDNEKAARLRAKERATLKHKNTGKWASHINGLQGSNNLVESRNAIEEQLRKGEQLRRRIQGRDSNEGEEEESDDDDDEGSQTKEDNAFDELRALEKKSEAQRLADEEEMQGKKGVWGMKFMKDARDRKAKVTQGEVDDLQREMEEAEESDREDESEDPDELDRRLLQAGANPGRRVFTSSSAAAAVASRQDEDGEEEDEVINGFGDKKLATVQPIVVHDTRGTSASGFTTEESGSNPWLAAKPSSKLSRKKNESTVSKEASAQSKLANRIQKHTARGDEERREAMEDAHLDIDPEARLALRSAQKGNVQSDDEDDSDDDDASLVDEPVAIRGKGPAAIQQRDLVTEAFAGDDVTADFAAEKAAIMEADAPQTIDTTLPGWGSWGGKGVRVNKKKAEEQKKKFAKVILGLDPMKRKDARMTEVIINQKKDKKADKYRGKDVPYPYTSRAQYEMAMRNPLGPEFNSRTQFQKLTLPRVVTKPGKAISPLEKLF